MIWCFGDSWGYGSELNENENPFVYHLAKDLGEKFKNFSFEGNSYPVMVTQIFDNIRNRDEDSFLSKLVKNKKIEKNDIVLIVVPPDIRWMDQEGDGFETWYYESDKERYRSWLGDKTKVWFRYHASLFTYSIQSVFCLLYTSDAADE